MASRKEEKEQRRAERLARESQEAEQARRRRVYSIVVGGALAVAAVAAVVIAVAAGGGGDGGSSSGSSVPQGEGAYDGPADAPPQQETDLVRAARAAGCRLSNPVIEGRSHVADANEKIEYKTNPPTSGNHDPQPAGDGVYSETVTASDLRHFVHTLEHGRVEVQYDPSLPKAQVDRIGGLYSEDPYHMILFPNRRIPYQVAASAWGHLIGCEKVTDETFDALRAFRDRYRDQGPEQVP